jgi:excisionase family DNA binding protein
MTIEEVAAFLKLSKITVYKLVKKGDIPAFRIGHSWRFLRDQIEGLLMGLSTKRQAKDKRTKDI